MRQMDYLDESGNQEYFFILYFSGEIPVSA